MYETKNNVKEVATNLTTGSYEIDDKHKETKKQNLNKIKQNVKNDQVELSNNQVIRIEGGENTTIE